MLDVTTDVILDADATTDVIADAAAEAKSVGNSYQKRVQATGM